MSSPDVAMPPVKVRRITSKPGRFDPSEPFHMSTRRATTTSTTKNPASVNGGGGAGTSSSANGSVCDDDDGGNLGRTRNSSDEMRPVTSQSNHGNGINSDADDDDAGIVAGVPPAVGDDVSGPSPYPVFGMNASVGLADEIPVASAPRTASGSGTPARESSERSLKRKRTMSMDRSSRPVDDDVDAVDFQQQQQQDRTYSSQGYNENEDITEVIDPALLSDHDGNEAADYDVMDDAMDDAAEDDAAENDADNDTADNDNDDADDDQEADSQNSSQSDEVNPTNAVEVDVSMDATPHISAPESPATSDSINDDDDNSTPLAKPLNEALKEVVRSSRLDTEEVAEDEEEDAEVDDGEEEIELADEGDEAEEQVRWGEEDGRSRRRVGGRRRAAHPIPIVEAHMRRQAQLKSAYRSIARAQKAILAELAERTVDDIEANEKRHTEVSEYEYVMAGLNDVLEKRKSQLRAQRDLTKKDLYQRWQAEQVVARKKHSQRVEDAREHGLDELELNMLSELRIAQLRETEPGYNTEDENDIVPLLNRVKYRWKGREELDARYDSRSRRQLETRRLGDQWMKRLDLQDLVAEHLAKNDDDAVKPLETHKGDVSVMNSGPRDYANARRQCIDDTRTLAAAAEEVERVAKLPFVKNEDAIGLQVLGDLASRPSITSGMRDAMLFPKQLGSRDSMVLVDGTMNTRSLLPPPPLPMPNLPPGHHHQHYHHHQHQHQQRFQHSAPPPIEPPPVPPIQFAVSPRTANHLLDNRMAHQMPPPSTPKQSTVSYLRSSDQQRSDPLPQTLPPPPGSTEMRLNESQQPLCAYPTDHRPLSRQQHHSQHYDNFRPGSFPPMREQPPPHHQHQHQLSESFASPSAASRAVDGATGPGAGSMPPLPLWRTFSQPEISALGISSGSSRPPSVGGPAPFPLAIVPASADDGVETGERLERVERGGGAGGSGGYKASTGGIKDEAVRVSPWLDRARPLYPASAAAAAAASSAPSSALEPGRLSEGQRLPPLHDSASTTRHQRTNSSSFAGPPGPRWRDWSARPSMSEPPAPQQQEHGGYPPQQQHYPPMEIQARPPLPSHFNGSPRTAAGGAVGAGEEKIRLPSLMPRELNHDLSHNMDLQQRGSSFGGFRPLEPSQQAFGTTGYQGHRPGETEHQRQQHDVSADERPRSAVSRPSSSGASLTKEKRRVKGRCSAANRESGSAAGAGPEGVANGTRRAKRMRRTGGGAENKDGASKRQWASPEEWGKKGVELEAEADAGRGRPDSPPPSAAVAGSGGMEGGSPTARARPPPLSLWPDRGPASGSHPPPPGYERGYEHNYDHPHSHYTHNPPPGPHSPRESRYDAPSQQLPPYYHGAAAVHYSAPPRRYSPPIPSPTDQERGRSYYSRGGDSAPAPLAPRWSYPPPPPVPPPPPPPPPSHHERLGASHPHENAYGSHYYTHSNLRDRDRDHEHGHSHSHSDRGHGHELPPSPLPGASAEARGEQHQQFNRNPYGPSFLPPSTQHRLPYSPHHASSTSLSSLPPPPPPPPSHQHAQHEHHHHHHHHHHHDGHQEHGHHRYERSPPPTTSALFPGSAAPHLASASSSTPGDRAEARASTVGPEPHTSAAADNTAASATGGTGQGPAQPPRLSGGAEPGGLPAFAQRGQGQSSYRRRRQSDGFHVHKFHNYQPSPTLSSGSGFERERERERERAWERSGTERDREIPTIREWEKDRVGAGEEDAESDRVAAGERSGDREGEGTEYRDEATDSVDRDAARPL